MGCTWKCQCGNKLDEPNLDVSQITLKILEDDNEKLEKGHTRELLRPMKVESTMQSDSRYWSSPESKQKTVDFQDINYIQNPSTTTEVSHRVSYDQALKFRSKSPTDFVTIWSSEEILIEGELMRYRPGISKQFISRWCQVTSFEFMYFKNQYSAQCWFDKPLCLVPLAHIQAVKRAKFKVAEKKQKYNKSNNQFQFELFLKNEDRMTELSRHADQDPLSASLLTKSCVNDQKQSVENGKLMKRPVRIESPERTDRSDVSKRSHGTERISWTTREIEWYTAERRLLFSAPDEPSCLLWISTIKNAITGHK